MLKSLDFILGATKSHWGLSTELDLLFKTSCMLGGEWRWRGPQGATLGRLVRMRDGRDWDQGVVLGKERNSCMWKRFGKITDRLEPCAGRWGAGGVEAEPAVGK